MIPDWEKNSVFVSTLLEKWYKPDYKKIHHCLSSNSNELKLIEQTKDIWARDYMPIQVSSNRFIQFRYEPRYLKGYKKYQTTPAEIKLLHDYNIKTSNINLDGGNIVCSSDKVILTERVYKENKELPKSKIQDELETLFEAEVLFVPDIESDMTGHIDGHLRFIDDNTIIVNQLKDEDKNWVKGFERMIQKSNLNVVEMPWYIDKKDKGKKSAIGSYLNYLQIEDLILFPIFQENLEIDEKCLSIIKTLLPDVKVESININKIGKEGGLMNCITWTVI